MAIIQIPSIKLVSKKLSTSNATLTASTNNTIVQINGAGTISYIKFTPPVNTVNFTFIIQIDGITYSTSQIPNSTASSVYYWGFSEVTNGITTTFSSIINPYFKNSFLLTVNPNSTVSSASPTDIFYSIES